MKEIYLSDMDDEDFSDYPDDTIFVLDDSRNNRKFDPATGRFYYEDSDPAEAIKRGGKDDADVR